MSKITIIILLLTTLGILDMQAQPQGTEIILVPVGRVGNLLSFGEPVNITKRNGYDNQPMFTADGKGLYYSSIQINEQSDIYYFDLESLETSQITNTPESEFSPTVWNGHDGFTVVSVEQDSSQMLWHYNSPNDRVSLFPEIKNIGYHAWATPSEAVFFLLTDTFSLQRAHLDHPGLRLIAKNIGRSLHSPQENLVYYVDKSDSNHWKIMSADLDAGESVFLCETFEGVEDFTLTNEGKIWMGHQSILYEFDPNQAHKGWSQLCDFSITIAADFYRLAFSQEAKMLALVVHEGKK